MFLVYVLGLFFFLGGSKGAVLDPPKVLFCFASIAEDAALLSRPGCAMFLVYVLSSDLGGCLEPAECFASMFGCFASLPRSCVFGLSRPGFFLGGFQRCCLEPAEWSMSSDWGSFLLRRGFQRCCFGPAESTVFCCASARI